jgi:hypothetical protein
MIRGLRAHAPGGMRHSGVSAIGFMNLWELRERPSTCHSLLSEKCCRGVWQ